MGHRKRARYYVRRARSAVYDAAHAVKEAIAYETERAAKKTVRAACNGVENVTNRVRSGANAAAERVRSLREAHVMRVNLCAVRAVLLALTLIFATAFAVCCVFDDTKKSK
ncbi:MAG: hypothetical protein IJF15_04640 [Oscillospiraceae bacterium]|nr:hypothetical protein [Oscillospiraceae bacterium]